jgi:hypothetical protein
MRRVSPTDDPHDPGALTRIAQATRRFLPAHPGYWEGILIQGARQFAGVAMFAALAIVVRLFARRKQLGVARNENLWQHVAVFVPPPTKNQKLVDCV